MHHMFTPSGKKGKEFQLFLPHTCILKSSHSIDNQTKSKKEATKQKSSHELQLDGPDIDFNVQRKILEEIRQPKGNTQQSKDIEESENNKATFAGMQQNEHHRIPPGSEYPNNHIMCMHGAERKPLKRYQQQEHKDRDLQSARHLDNPVKTFYSSYGKSNYFTFHVN